jgi:hypothetical protein
MNNKNNSSIPPTSGLLLTLHDPDEIKNMIRSAVSEAISEMGIAAPKEPRFVSQSELAAILGYCIPTIMEMRKKGRIKGVRHGNKWKFELNEVWEALKATEPGQKHPAK